MTQEEKELLLRDICGRLPYFTIAYITYKEGSKTMEGNLPVTTDDIDMLYESVDAIEEAHYTIKPYLRPMSSMTEVEKEKYERMTDWKSFDWEMVDFYNEHHLDYRGLIKKGLALEAPEDMYKTK